MRKDVPAILLAMILAPGLALAESTPVVRLQNLAHAVTSLDKTLPFYRDALGFTVNGTRASRSRSTPQIQGSRTRKA